MLVVSAREAKLKAIQRGIKTPHGGLFKRKEGRECLTIAQ